MEETGWLGKCEVRHIASILAISSCNASDEIAKAYAF